MDRSPVVPRPSRVDRDPPLAPQTLGGNHFRSAGNPSELKIELQAEPRNARRPVLHTPACEDRIISLSHKVDRWRHAPPAVTRTRRGRNSAGSAPRLWPLPLARSSRSASSAMVQATPAPPTTASVIIWRRGPVHIGRTDHVGRMSRSDRTLTRLGSERSRWSHRPQRRTPWAAGAGGERGWPVFPLAAIPSANRSQIR